MAKERLRGKPEERTQLYQALQQWTSNQQLAVEGLTSLADSDYLPAAALYAWMLVQVVRWTEGIPYAERAAKAGAVTVLNNYIGQLLSDSSHRATGIRFVRELLDSGWPTDPLGYSVTAAQQGDQAASVELVELAVSPAPSGARAKWQELLEETETASTEVRNAAGGATAARDRAIETIQSDEALVAQERERVERLVQEVSDLAHQGAAAHLAKEYAAQAARVERSASRYTAASVAVGALAAISTCVIAYFAFTREHGTGAVLTKAALALPILAFAAYIGRLGAVHRQQAWRWRHIELQIRTAEPFVAPLDEERRRVLIAALALRFFPGQGRETNKDEEAPLADPAALLNQLLNPAAGSPQSSVGAPPPSEP